MPPSAVNRERFLFAEEVSEWTRVPENTLAYWRTCKKGPPWAKLGGKRVVYRESDVQAWLDAQFDGAAS